MTAARTCEIAGHPAWERGLFARPALPLRRRGAVETLVWVVRPASLPIRGNVYTDGSFRDGFVPELGREGWSFVILDDDGNVAASAYGIPPPWCNGIEGAEAWALYQALLYTLPCLSLYWTDCLPLLTAVMKGPVVASDPRNCLARIHGMIHTQLDEGTAGNVGWMPAHLTDREIGVAVKSNDALVTVADLKGNTMADTLAKV